MRKLAMLVANDTFPSEPSLQTLRYPQRDATELASVLADPEIARFETEILLNQPAHQIRRSLELHSRALGPDDIFLFYYAGHGRLANDGTLCLAAFDTTAKTLLSDSVQADDLLELMRAGRARRRLVILDCCHSGAIGTSFRGGGAETTLASLATSYGTYIMTASTAVQLADEREQEGHGLFTYALVEGLRDGKAAKPGQDRITVSDWHDYASIQLGAKSSQTPLLWALRQEGATLEIADLSSLRRNVSERMMRKARERFGRLVADGHFSQPEADRFLRLLEPDAFLLPFEKAYRKRVIAFLQGEISLADLLGEAANPAPNNLHRQLSASDQPPLSFGQQRSDTAPEPQSAPGGPPDAAARGDEPPHVRFSGRQVGPVTVASRIMNEVALTAVSAMAFLVALGTSTDYRLTSSATLFLGTAIVSLFVGGFVAQIAYWIARDPRFDWPLSRLAISAGLSITVALVLAQIR